MTLLFPSGVSALNGILVWFPIFPIIFSYYHSPIFCFFKAVSPIHFNTWSCKAWLFIFQNSIALWPWSWGVGGGGGKNDLGLINVLSLFSACHLQCWRQRVTGSLYMVRWWPHLIQLPFGSIWCWWMCLFWLGAMHGFLGGGAQLHSEPRPLCPRFLEALSEGQLCLDSAWAFDAFCWISLLVPKSLVPPPILMSLEKEPGELLRLGFALSKLHRELYVVALPYFLPCMVAPQALEALLHWLLQ